LLQAQAEREIAVNRIATAIRNSLKLDSILQTAANEVGRALGVSSGALRANGELIGGQKTACYFQVDLESEDAEKLALANDLNELGWYLADNQKSYVMDGGGASEAPVFPRAAVPLSHHGRSMGLLLVRDNDLGRQWAENELLLLRTVADQVIVAIN